jgi:MFS family permease
MAIATPPSEAMALAEGTDPDTQPWPSRKLAWYALVLVTLATMMNFMDITVFGLMVESIKHDFGLTDDQLGQILGLAAILFYLVIGIPLARLADIYPRNIVLGVGLIITSATTALTGLVQNFGQLFFGRALAGVGGSAHAPATYSILADYFPPKKLARAIGFLQLGFILGTGLGGIIGGALLAYVAGWQATQVGPFLVHNWQWVLIWIALPGFLIAGLILALPEPPRRGKVTAGKALPISAVFREIGARRGVYIPLFLGLALSSLEAGGLGPWRVPFMIRSYGWTPAQIGAWSGFISFVALPAGVIFGSWLTEFLSRRRKDGPVLTTVIVFSICVPLSIASPLMPTGELAMLTGALAGVFGFAAAVPQNVAIQTVTPNEMRGQVTAVYLFMFIAFGALGAWLVPQVTNLVGGEQNLWIAMAVIPAALLPLAIIAIAAGMKPYAREVGRLEAIRI